MLRRLFLLISVVVLSSACVANAAPVGNIAAPAISKSLFLTTGDGSAVGFISGFDANLIFDRKIENTDKAELNFYTGKLGMTVKDKALFYVLLGGADGKFTYNVSGSKIELETDTAFSWGVGATVILLEKEVNGFGNGILRFGGDLKYRYSEPDINANNVVVDGVKRDISSVANSSVEYGEFQGAIGVSYQINKFVPYMGVKFTKLTGEEKITVSGTEYKQDYDADDAVGMFVGADILITDSIALHVEGSLIDEEAITIGGTIRF